MRNILWREWFKTNCPLGLMLFSIFGIVVIVGAIFLPEPFLPTVKLEASVEDPPLRLSIQLDKGEYMVGENMTISFRLKNTSNQTVCKSFCSYPIPLFGFIVYDQNNATVLESTAGQLMILWDLRLPPEGERNDTTVWNQRQNYFLEHSYLPPGAYYMKGLVQGYPDHGLGTPPVVFIVKLWDTYEGLNPP